MVDQSGAITTSYGYGPFGDATQQGASDPNPFQYTGRELDETGLYFYRARYYNPDQGRFISEDPIGLSGGDPNLYAYVGNSPTNAIDPSGNCGINTLLAALDLQSRLDVAQLALIHQFAAGGMSRHTFSDAFGANIRQALGELASTAAISCAMDIAMLFLPGAGGGAVGGRGAAAGLADDLPSVIYRGGRHNPANLTPRPVDEGVLSFRNSLSNPIDSATRPVFSPGKPYIGIDPSKLPPGSVVVDNTPPGHVSVTGVSVEDLLKAIIEKGKFPK